MRLVLGDGMEIGLKQVDHIDWRVRTSAILNLDLFEYRQRAMICSYQMFCWLKVYLTVPILRRRRVVTYQFPHSTLLVVD
jgi:hypothetical protein